MPVLPLAIFLWGDEKQEMNRKDETATSDQSTGKLGPNGGRIEYMSNGDMVEWVRNNEDETEWPILLRRNDNDIIKTYKECRDKVWWNLHQNQLCRIKSGEEDGKSISEEAKRAARRIERRYGRKKSRVGRR